MNTFRSLLPALVLALLGPSAPAQPGTRADSAGNRPTARPEASEPGSPSPLAGPTVSVRASDGPTIVERDAVGAVKLPEPTPEEAAIRVIDLEPAARARVERVLTRRSLVLDEFVLDNIDLLTRFGQAEASGNKVDQFILLDEAGRRLGPLWKQGKLADRLREALPESRRADFDRVLREFWAELVRDRQAKPNDQGQRRSAFEILIEARLQTLGQELQSAFQRAEKSGELVFRVLFKGIELTDDQRARARELIGAHVETYGDAAGDKENAALFFALQGMLTTDQKRLLVTNVKGLSS
jgi:hypothetical protein